MSEVYLLGCRDIGLDCDFQARGTSLEEVMQRSAAHGAERHGMTALGPEQYLKMHRAVTTTMEPDPQAPATTSSVALPPGLALEATPALSGAAHVVLVTGRLDSATSEAFDAWIHELVASGAIRLVLDLAHVNYVSSAGLRSLLMLLKQVKPLGGGLVLAAVHPRVKDILDIAGFTAMFTMAPTPADALARLQPAQ